MTNNIRWGLDNPASLFSDENAVALGGEIRRIRQPAGYGDEVLSTLVAKLVPGFANGFNVRNLSRMIRFAEAFPDTQIVATLSPQLS